MKDSSACCTYAINMHKVKQIYLEESVYYIVKHLSNSTDTVFLAVSVQYTVNHLSVCPDIFNRICLKHSYSALFLYRYIQEYLSNTQMTSSLSVSTDIFIRICLHKTLSSSLTVSINTYLLYTVNSRILQNTQYYYKV